MPMPRLAACALALALALAACQGQEPPATATAPASPSASPSIEAPAAPAAAMPMTAADASAAVAASMRKFLQASSFHALMTTHGGPTGMASSELDFVAPDRFRIRSLGAPGQYVIGNTMTITANGRRMRVPVPAGTTARWRDPAGFATAGDGMTVDFLGEESLYGLHARKYRLHRDKPADTDATLWIGDDDLPLELEARGTMAGQPYTTSVQYSRFNDPGLSIDLPK